MTAPQRTLNELRVLYDARPGVRDVVVEGRRHAGFVRSFLRSQGIRSAVVYAVGDRAEIPAGDVRSVGVDVGERGKVIALAVASATWGAVAGRALTCMIDANGDCLADGELPGESLPNLIRTHLASFDSFSLNPDPLQRFIDIAVRRDLDAESILDQIIPALNEIFLIRHALKMSEKPVAIISRYMRLVNFSSGSIAVDTERIVERSLVAAGAGSLISDVMANVQNLRGRLPDDRRRAVRGHDIAPMVVAHLNPNPPWNDSEAVADALAGFVDPNSLVGVGEFARLAERLDLK